MNVSHIVIRYIKTVQKPHQKNRRHNLSTWVQLYNKCTVKKGKKTKLKLQQLKNEGEQMKGSKSR